MRLSVVLASAVTIRSDRFTLRYYLREIQTLEVKVDLVYSIWDLMRDVIEPSWPLVRIDGTRFLETFYFPCPNYDRQGGGSKLSSLTEEGKCLLLYSLTCNT